MGCGHAPQRELSADVLAVTVLAARYALTHEVPAVQRGGAPVCLEVDGQPPPSEVLSRLASGPVQVLPGASPCAGPRAVLLQVSNVVVSDDAASARAGVRLGPSGVLNFRKADGKWLLSVPSGTAGASGHPAN